MKEQPEKLTDLELSALALIADIRAAVGDPKGKKTQQELIEYCKELKALHDAYERKLNMLQSNLKRMREPEQNLVCDILANGQLLPDPDGKRYGVTGSRTALSIESALRRMKEIRKSAPHQYPRLKPELQKLLDEHLLIGHSVVFVDYEKVARVGTITDVDLHQIKIRLQYYSLKEDGPLTATIRPEMILAVKPDASLVHTPEQGVDLSQLDHIVRLWANVVRDSPNIKGMQKEQEQKNQRKS